MEKTYLDMEKILEQYVRPGLKMHNGNIQLTDIKNGIAYVKFTGHCSGCPSAKYTMESMVKEEVLKHTDEVSDVKLIEEVSQELYDFAKNILHSQRRA